MATKAGPVQAQGAAAENFAACSARPVRRLGPIRPLVTVGRLHHLVRFPGLATIVFVIGNLFAWSGFALLAALAQWALQVGGALDPGMALANPTARGLLLVAAGAWQWTPLKQRSLEHC